MIGFFRYVVIPTCYDTAATLPYCYHRRRSSSQSVHPTGRDLAGPPRRRGALRLRRRVPLQHLLLLAVPQMQQHQQQQAELRNAAVLPSATMAPPVNGLILPFFEITSNNERKSRSQQQHVCVCVCYSVCVCARASLLLFKFGISIIMIRLTATPLEVSHDD